MRPQQILFSGLMMLALALPTWAQEQFRQTRVNVTIRVPNFEHAARDLRGVSDGFDAQLENLNLDINSGSGSANFKVPVDQVSEVMAKLDQVGVIESQSQSTSDYTSSVLQYERKAAAFRALAKVDGKSLLGNIPVSDRGEMLNEFQSFVTNGLQSNESSALNYRQMAKIVEISVTINGAKSTAAAPPTEAVDPTTGEPLQAISSPTPPANDSRPIYLLCLMNFLGLWLIYRRVDRTEPSSPETTPHTH